MEVSERDLDSWRCGPASSRRWASIAASALGPLARAQGDADLAWTMVSDTLPRGTGREPGTTGSPTRIDVATAGHGARA